ncbi:MAG: ATPase [Crocinitomicaceae bacterium]|nr:ATPase [Crocinitomicaceae bacterium]|tara:strand:+ start:2522 stop:3376 length:855 start_codon:yes stop_codon:yes gene_type:complete
MTSKKNINITKHSGEPTVFDVKRLKNSLERSGAKDDLINDVVKEVEKSLYEGISTKEIYKKAFSILRKNARPSAARYKLKKAIMELGPTGYPFEKFVGEILRHQGFDIQVGVIIKGHCVNHEVDVVAEKDTKHFMVECKFHSQHNRHCNVKIPLYIQSRFKDIEKQWKSRPGHETKFHQGWIFTNTRFTSDAIQYGKCAGLMLIGWDYPKKGSLKERIDFSGLHPVTCLTTLTKQEKQKLLEKNMVLCKEICENHDILSTIGIKDNRHHKIMSEANDLCQGKIL